MSLDLRILPQYKATADISLDVFDTMPNNEFQAIFLQLEKDYGQEVSDSGFNSFSGNVDDCDLVDTGYTKTLDTPYGKRIVGVKAKYVKAALVTYQASHWKNRAVISYLLQIPNDLDLTIWFYWH